MSESQRIAAEAAEKWLAICWDAAMDMMRLQHCLRLHQGLPARHKEELPAKVPLQIPVITISSPHHHHIITTPSPHHHHVILSIAFCK
jgi:hypothetical protein